MRCRSLTGPGRAASCLPLPQTQATVRSNYSEGRVRRQPDLYKPGCARRARPGFRLGSSRDPEGKLKLNRLPGSARIRGEKAVAKPFLRETAHILTNVSRHGALRSFRQRSRSDRPCLRIDQHGVDNRTELPPLVIFTHGHTPLFTNCVQTSKVRIAISVR